MSDIDSKIAGLEKQIEELKKLKAYTNKPIIKESVKNNPDFKDIIQMLEDRINPDNKDYKDFEYWLYEACVSAVYENTNAYFKYRNELDK